MNYRVIVGGSREFTDADTLDNELYITWDDKVGHKNMKDKLTIITSTLVGAARLANASAANNSDVAQLELHSPDYATYGTDAEKWLAYAMIDSGADEVLLFGEDTVLEQVAIDAEIPVRKFDNDGKEADQA